MKTDQFKRDALICQRHQEGMRPKAIAKEFKVSPGHILRVIARGDYARLRQVHATAEASLRAETAAGRVEIEQGLARIAASRGQKL